jgi:hypothetical protein
MLEQCFRDRLSESTFPQFTRFNAFQYFFKRANAHGLLWISAA